MSKHYEITDGNLHAGWASEDYMFNKMDDRVLKGEANFDFHIGKRDAVDIAPLRHGHWEEKKVEYDDKAEIIQEWQSAKCSVCGLYETKPYLYYPVWSNYCPNCGAIMDEKGE